MQFSSSQLGALVFKSSSDNVTQLTRSFNKHVTVNTGLGRALLHHLLEHEHCTASCTADPQSSLSFSVVSGSAGPRLSAKLAPVHAAHPRRRRRRTVPSSAVPRGWRWPVQQSPGRFQRRRSPAWWSYRRQGNRDRCRYFYRASRPGRWLISLHRGEVVRMSGAGSIASSILFTGNAAV